MKQGESTTWPSIEAAYTDEFGDIDAEVYAVAGEIWPQAERFALSTLHDHEVGLRLMLKAVAIVSRRRSEENSRIDNLRAFLFRVFKNLILADLKKQNRRREIAGRWEHEVAQVDQTADAIDRRILIEELVSRMDSWTRKVLEWRMLDRARWEQSVGRGCGVEVGHRARV